MHTHHTRTCCCMKSRTSPKDTAARHFPPLFVFFFFCFLHTRAFAVAVSDGANGDNSTFIHTHTHIYTCAARTYARTRARAHAHAYTIKPLPQFVYYSSSYVELFTKTHLIISFSSFRTQRDLLASQISWVHFSALCFRSFWCCVTYHNNRVDKSTQKIWAKQSKQCA